MTNLVLNRPTEDAAEPPQQPASKALLVGILGGLVALAVLSVAFGKGLYALGAFGFVVALLVSVSLHEGGHFWTARRFGMKATQFFVGFGPTIWSRQRGETEWGFKAIPAGGFVKIVGMTQLEEVPEADQPRAFWRQPAGQRVVVLAAGSTVHFLIAIVLVLFSSLAIGQAVEKAPGLGAIAPCVTAAADGACTDGGSLASPAKTAGLQADDVVTAVDGKPVDGVLAFVEAIRDKPGVPTVLTVQRGDASRQVTVIPASVLRPSIDDPAKTQRVGAIGVQLAFRSGTERLGPIAAVRYSGEQMVTIVKSIGTTLTQKLSTITKVYGPDRDPQGFIGPVGAGRVSGEVLASQETLAFKVLAFLGLIAGLNFFVGVFNLLPLLPLDGGHIAVLLFEQGRDKIRRTFGYRGELRRVDPTKLLPVTYAVVLLFAVFTVWLLGADIVNPIKIS